MTILRDLPLGDGGRIVLADSDSLPKETRQRNVFRVDSRWQTTWQVTDYDPMPISRFTNVYFTADGSLRGYNFDGGEYNIDLETGKCTPGRFLK